MDSCDQLSYIKIPEVGEWNFIDGNSSDLFFKLSQNKITLSEITDRIFQGLKTSADKIFIVKKISEEPNYYQVYSEQTKNEYKVEKQLFHPLIKGGHCTKFSFKQSELLILFPYENALLIPIKTLQENYPLTYSYLEENKTYLQNRENGKFKNHLWYAYGRNQALDVITTPKIFTPDLSPNASYALDRTGKIYFTGGVAGGYGIKVKSSISELYILGLLNSKLLDWYLKKISTQMRGGWYSFEAKFIRNLPIVIPAKTQIDIYEKIINSVTKIEKLKSEMISITLSEKLEQINSHIEHLEEQIDDLVFILYGLSSEEIKLIQSV